MLVVFHLSQHTWHSFLFTPIKVVTYLSSQNYVGCDDSANLGVWFQLHVFSRPILDHSLYFWLSRSQFRSIPQIEYIYTFRWWFHEHMNTLMMSCDCGQSFYNCGSVRQGLPLPHLSLPYPLHGPDQIPGHPLMWPSKLWYLHMPPSKIVTKTVTPPQICS